MENKFILRKRRKKAETLRAVSYSVLFLFIFTLSLSFINAVPPVTTTQNFEHSIIIEDSQQYFLKLNKDFQINFFAYNSSNGLGLDDAAINCIYYLSDNEGTLLFYGNVNYDSYWNLNIEKGNLSYIGNYFYGIQCNGTNLGGATTGTYEVNNKALESTTSQALFYGFVLIILIFLFLLCGYGALHIPYSNTENNEGGVIQINWKKYSNMFCWGMSYLFLLSIVFVTWNLIYAYSDWYSLSKLFEYVYRIIFLFMFPFLIGWFIMLIVNYIDDKKIQKFIKKSGLPFYS